MRRGLRWAAVLVVSTLAVAIPGRAADTLEWNTRERRVDADVHAWPLPRVLETITAATGWEVWVEPATEHPVTARFDALAPAEALRRLLGDLNFALLPQVGGPPKLFVYRHSVGAATELVRKRTGPRAAPIAEELLVVLKRDRTDIEALAKRIGARVAGRMDGLGAYRLRFDDAAAARKGRAQLEQDDEVSSVETNLEIAPPAVLEPLAMSSPAELALQPDVSPATDKVIVGLIDTAVQANGSVVAPFLQPAVSFLEGDALSAGGITHGTAMAETILDGIARALAERGDGSRSVPISILPVDVYGGAETTNTFEVARGLNEAMSRHVNVINLSLGGETDSPLLQRLIATATDRGVLVFAAAGNVPGTAPVYPAADPAVIAVTAADAQGNVASWANRGAFVDAIAPGANVVHLDDRAWFGTGTSFSTSWVTGWAAAVMARSTQPSSATRQQTLSRWGLRP
jgi:hypothetical protein